MVDGSALKEGDYAGICALQGCYGLIALTKEAGKYFLVMLAKELDKDDNILGLILFSTKEIGGEADFEQFVYHCLKL